MNGEPPGLAAIGRDIDDRLRSARYDEAAALCREILRREPHAVRPRCTLAWICLGKGRLWDVQTEIIGYVTAARAAGELDRAARQLRQMIGAAFAPDVRRFLAEQLARLGHTSEAQEAIGEMHADLAAAQVPSEEEQRDIWRIALNAALSE